MKPLLIFVTALAAVEPASAATQLFTDRAEWEAAVGARILDTFETSEGYPAATAFLTDAAMSAVVGETRFETTGAPASNTLFTRFDGDTIYCALQCNSSFTLHFENSSLSDGTGVFGLGLDLSTNNGPAFFDPLITFGDGTTGLFLFNPFGTGFVGIISDERIRSVAFGPGGLPSTDGLFAIDNVTLAAALAVPAPAGWMVLPLPLMLAAALRRRAMI